MKKRVSDRGNSFSSCKQRGFLRNLGGGARSGMWFQRMRWKLPLFLAFAGIVLLNLGVVSAATATWNCTTTNTFDTVACWTTGSIPVAGDDVVFNATGNGIVNITNNTLPQNLNSFTVESSYNQTIHFNALFANGSWADSDTDYGAIGTQYWNVTNNINISGGTMKIYGDYVGNATDSVGYNLTAEGEGQQWRSVNGNITIGSGATLDGQGLGFPKAAGPGYYDTVRSGTHGGRGYQNIKDPYGNATAPVSLGSGGASFAGGSAIKLSSSNLIFIDGTLDFEGVKGSQYSGAGGSIWLKADSLSGNGNLIAFGGNVTTCCSAGGAGGGRIRLEYGSFMQFNGSISVDAGYGNNHPGIPGTLTFTNNTWPNDWILTSNIGLLGGNFGDGGVINVLGNFDTNGKSIATYGDCFYNSANPITCYNTTADGRGVWINASGNITISSGSVLDGKALGFPELIGPGYNLGSGSAHGGKGGAALVDKSYGNATAPVSLGSGGASGTGAGGSAIKLETENYIYLNGTIDMGSSLSSSSSSTASGGSIFLQGGSILGNNFSLYAQGQTTSISKTGAGGRIAIIGDTINLTGGLVYVDGGRGTASLGGGGTVYINATNFIRLDANVSSYGGVGGYINITDTLLTLSGIYNSTGSSGNGATTVNYTDCSSTLIGTFIPSKTDNSLCVIPPIVTLLSPLDNSRFNSGNLYFIANFTDNLGLANSTFYLWNSTSDLINTTIDIITGTLNSTNLSVTLPYEDTFTWNYLAYDNNSNNAFGSSNYTFIYNSTLDITPPNLTINSPLNGTTYSTLPLNFTFNVTLSENASLVQYSLDNGVNNFTMSSTDNQNFNASNYSMADGTYTFRVYANDTSGNRNDSEFVTFFVNTSFGTATEIEQWGITFYFNQTTTYGKFANGDYWVLGPVNITNITPEFNGSLHGWEVNPNHTLQQGFDSRVANFNSSFVPNIPYFSSGNESIVKVISNVSSSPLCPDGSGSCPLITAGVLTVFDFIPQNNGSTLFRPAYFGSEKRLFYTSNLDTDILPSLNSTPHSVSLSTVEGRFKRVQLDHKTDWQGRNMHPYLNLRDYGAEIASEYAENYAVLSLNYTVEEKWNSLIYGIQAGIDFYGVLNGGGGWPSNGGHTNGRKLPIVFASVILDDSDMKDLAGTDNQTKFSELGQLQKGINQTPIFGTNGTVLAYWDNLVNDAGIRTIADPYNYIDGGLRPGGSYQACCTTQPWKGHVLNLHLISQLRPVWNDTIIIDYIDRWVNNGSWTQPDICAPADGICVDGTNVGGYCNTAGENGTACGSSADTESCNSFCGGGGWCNYSANYASNYGVTYGHNSTSGTCILDTNSSDGIGRFVDRHLFNADGGTYGSTFINELWTEYRNLSTYGLEPPTITITLPTATTYTTSSLAFNVSLNENGTAWFSLDSGAANYTMTGDEGAFGTAFNYTYSGLTDGTYTFNAYANDTAGNQNNSAASVSFTIAISSSGSTTESSSGGGDPNYVPPFYTNTYVRDLNDLQFSGELVQVLEAKERARIKILGEKHHVGVISIEGNVVKIGVESEEQTAELKIAGDAKFDLNDDGFYDLIVVLKSLIVDKAKLGMKWIYEEVPAVPVEEKEEEITEESEDEGLFGRLLELPAYAYYIALGVVAGLIILIFVLWQLSKPPHLRNVFRGRH
ncbi:hypothetical protein COU58_02945 [Candidatus Pacearchaeota archaeon CG10_big_fil_rev_8_21_14_0_10_32_42]|nr:MAG: hypothetical protein COU58_02945 [Candidatus Pacearchaeota archaeon CG10_big_fil_rev_8_21_14_0_10_32_42]